jgi:hypothetical protein
MESKTKNQCVVCGSVKGCKKYSVTDNLGIIKTDYACKNCAEEFGLETSAEEEDRNKGWWRSHLKMRLGREITDEQFEDFYKNLNKEKMPDYNCRLKIENGKIVLVICDDKL